MRRLRPLTEAECYARCYYGEREWVRPVPVGARLERAVSTLSGEDVRRLFEGRLERREPEVEAA